MDTSRFFSSIKTNFTTLRRLPQRSFFNNGTTIQQQKQHELPSASLQASNEINDDNAEIVALNMILVKPKEADGYLLAGRLYEKQGRLSAARVMYADSLTHVSYTNPRYSELQHSLKKLDLRCQSFISVFPYDLLCIIFSYLARDDLIQCIGVCQAWSHFMLQWPVFWNSLDDIIGRATIDSLLNGKDDQFHMQGIMEDYALFNCMLQFLVASGARNIKHIHYEDMLMEKNHIDLTVKATTSRISTVERMTFKDVPLGDPAIVLLGIVAQCPQLRHFSWRVGKRSDDMRIPFLLQNNPVEDPPLNFPYDVYMITTLDLHMGRGYNGFGPRAPSKVLPNLIKRCPHLERLNICSHDNIDHDKVMHTAIKYCPHLKDLTSTNPFWEIPSSAKYTQGDIVGSEKKGLERFLFSFDSQFNSLISTSNAVSIIKKNHKTLSTVYLHCDKSVTDTRFLSLLARYEMPQLRKLYLYTQDDCKGHAQDSGRRNSSFSKAIATLATRCPQLQILHIVKLRADRFYFGGIELPLEDPAIRSLRKHCHFLEKLMIDTI